MSITAHVQHQFSFWLDVPEYLFCPCAQLLLSELRVGIETSQLVMSAASVSPKFHNKASFVNIFRTLVEVLRKDRQDDTLVSLFAQIYLTGCLHT